MEASSVIAPSPSPPSPPSSIDALLERYLTLLDEYTTLRAELSRLQTTSFQNIARANFAAERGVRYGADFYDERMRAVRIVSITTGTGRSGSDAGLAMYRVVKLQRESPSTAAGEASEKREDPEATSNGEENAAAPAAAKEQVDLDHQDGHREDEQCQEVQPEGERLASKQGNATSNRTNDPLRWFGILTPLALRQAQASAIDAVEQVIPRLVTVDAEMRAVEIEVRRARKKRAKAEGAAMREQQLVREEAVVS